MESSEVDQCKSHSVEMTHVIKTTFYYSNFQLTNQLNNYFNSLILTWLIYQLKI